jgi:hypothetical protein
MIFSLLYLLYYKPKLKLSIMKKQIFVVVMVFALFALASCGNSNARKAAKEAEAAQVEVKSECGGTCEEGATCGESAESSACSGCESAEGGACSGGEKAEVTGEAAQ